MIIKIEIIADEDAIERLKIYNRSIHIFYLNIL